MTERPVSRGLRQQQNRTERAVCGQAVSAAHRCASMGIDGVHTLLRLRRLPDQRCGKAA